MVWRRRSTEDFSEEIRAHIAHETDRLIAEGMNPEEAARAARRRFGNVTAATERFHESRRRLWLDELRQDVHAAWRNLVRYPVVAIVVVLSLGAGIGATAAGLTVRDMLFQNPPPLYVEPEQLSKIQVNRVDRPFRPIGGYVPGDLFMVWRTALGASIAGVEAREGLGDVRSGDRLEPTRVRAVTPDFFTVLGIRPASGRFFSSSAESPSAPPAVLSYRLWQQWFDGRPDAIGATIWIDNHPHSVIGVAPRQFWFSELGDPVWTQLDAERLDSKTRVHVVVRRPSGTSPALLAAGLQASLDEHSRRMPPGDGPLKMRVSEIKGTPMADQMSMILPYVFGTAVLLTLLIACANVAILMIAQWTRREAETAVRSALGASRMRLIRALVTESLLLAVCAGALGVAGTYAIRAIMLRGATIVPIYFDASIHPGVLIKTAVITLLAGILAGIGPALLETRRLQIDPLRSIATSDRVRQRWSHALVVVEITMTLALLVVSSSMITGYQRSRGADLGFGVDPLLVAIVSHPSGVPTTQLLETVSQVPGVNSVAAATSIPLTGVGRSQPVNATAAGTNDLRAERISIDPNFFSTLRVPMRGGRAFTNQDTLETHTAIVSETLARQLFGGASPVGRQVWIDKVAYDIVGVVADYMSNPVESRLMTPKIFLPLSIGAKDSTDVRFLIRATGDASTLVEPVRRALRNGPTGITVRSAYSLRQMLTVQGQEYLAGTAPLFPLVVIGMVLTSSGIYGVLAFAISRRSREIAIRIAIGAARGNQIRLVLAQSLRLVLIGSACGIALTFALSRLVRATGGGGSLFDPPWPAFVIPVVIVALAAALATWIPTRRALRVNPASLLKAT
jgi:predicted permease